MRWSEGIVSFFRARPRLSAAVAPVVLALACGLYLALFVPRLNGHQHAIGEDYSYFLPHLIAVADWFHLNGWFAVPWYSPAFCGGVPLWANPQSMPYSVPQWLMQFVDPVTTVQLTFGIFAVLGAWGMWTLLRRGFATSRSAALVGAVIFLFNGFYSRRMQVGHFAFHPTMLAPWVAWFLVRARKTRRQLIFDGLAAGALLGVMIHGGMAVILPPIVLSWVAVGLLQSFRKGGFVSFVGRFSLALVTGAAVAASKLAAAMALMKVLPRDHYSLPGFENPVTELSVLLQSLFFRTPDISDRVLAQQQFMFEPHEWDYGLTPVPLMLLLAAAVVIARSRSSSRAEGRRWMLFGLGALLLLPVAVNFYSPGWNALLKHVPIIKSSSALIRWFVLYIPVLPVMAALALDRLPWRPLVAAAGAVATVGWSLSFATPGYGVMPYDPRSMLSAWATSRADGRVPAITAVDAPLDAQGRPRRRFAADDSVAQGVSQAFCYEPLFGYLMEDLPWRPLHSGSALDASAGVLNIKNPSCYVFPRENRCEPGVQFAVEQRAAAEAFLSLEPVPFAASTGQHVADAVNVVALVGLLVGLLLTGRRQTASAVAPAGDAESGLSGGSVK